MRERDELLAEIDREMVDTARLTGRERLSPRVRAALARVPREEFVPPEEKRLAYLNTPLPIGYGQTISQPFIVAIMSELLDLAEDTVVLEVGTGSGYQAAVLAELARYVYTVETIPELAARARDLLARLGYRNVEVRAGDGYLGWPEQAPFKAIMVTAGASEIPPPLVEQLAPGGRMLIPVGSWPGGQTLDLVAKDAEGNVSHRDVLPVAFVPLRRRRESRSA
jgi:protein-L-isoaspartate(D-aspartate) O-methyltransferase